MIWLKIASVRATWMEDRQESVSFDNGLGESADLEWRLRRGRVPEKRWRFPGLSLISLTGLLVLLSRGSEAARL